MSNEDLVINTDIDRLIDILSQKKRVELDDLEKELKLEKKQIKKWLSVLEEEGYLKLEYKLTKMYAVWLLDLSEGSQISLPHIVEDDVKKSAEIAIESAEISESPFSSVEAEVSEIPKEKVIKKKKEKKVVEKSDSLIEIKKKASDNAKEAEAIKQEIIELIEKSNMISQVELPQLEKESFEKVNGISERILSLNKHISSLQKSIKSATTVASGVSQRSKTAKLVIDEASDVYIALTDLFNELKNSLKSRNNSITNEINVLQSEIEKDEHHLDKMKSSLSEIETIEKDLEKKSIALRETVHTLNKTLGETADLLEQIEGRKGKFESKLSTLRNTISKKHSELTSLNKEVEGLGHLDAKLDNYIKEYMKETDDIRLLVTKAESDIREIEENANEKAMEVYLKELEKVSERTEEKAKDLEERSSKVEKEIKEKKEKLKSLIGSAKETVKKARKKR